MKRILILSLAGLALTATASADTLRSAELTQVIKDVKVYRGKAAGKTANVGDKVDGATSVTTGRRSRAELTFQDKTITRLGQNSVFSFRNGSRDIKLEKGSLMLQVPKGAGGATIRTATVTAAITGTTSMFEYNPGHWVKLITLEGTQEIRVKGQDPVKVPAGQMIIMRPDGRVIPKPVTIDLAKLLATSKLADRNTFGDLPAPAQAAIDNSVGNQDAGKRSGAFVPTRKVVTSPTLRTQTKTTSARITTHKREYSPKRVFTVR